MNHNELLSALKAGSVARLYLFEGEEEYAKKSALARLEKALDLGAFADMNRTVLKDPDADAIIAAAETLPLMAPKRLVIVRDSSMLTGKAKDYDEAASADRLKAYLPQLPDTTVAVFYVTGLADKRKKLYQTLKKSAELVSFDRLKREELHIYIAKYLKQAGYTVESDAVERLVFSVGDELSALLSEADKLIAYCDGRNVVTAEDVAAVCAVGAEYRVFELAQTILSGRGVQAFEMLRGLRLDGEAPLKLLALLTRQCRQVYDAKIYLSERVPQATIAARLGIPPFAVRQLVPLSSRYTVRQLADLIAWCTELEFRVKSGLLAEESVMEQAILHILTMQQEKEA